MSDKQNNPVVENSDELILLKTVVVNEKLSLNFYKVNSSDEKFIGLSHFLFEDDLILKEDTLKKISEIVKIENLKTTN